MSAPTGSRAAFTLLELVLALALSTVVVALIFQGLSATRHAVQTGAADQQRLELVNVLRSQLRETLGRLETDQTAAISWDNLASTQSQTAPDRTPSQASVTGLWGHETALCLVSWTPLETEQKFGRAARELSVWWTTGSATLKIDLPQESTPLQFAASAPGLSVCQQEFPLPKELGGEFAHGRSVRAVPEVTALRFRYFDGGNWTTTWNSQERRSLPRAVEVELSFGPQTLPDRFVVPLRGGREKARMGGPP